MNGQRVAGLSILVGVFGGLFAAEGLTLGWVTACVSFVLAAVLIGLIILGTELAMR